MSSKALVEARCPLGCEPFEARVWSVVRGDRDPYLKEKIRAGELNLLFCPHCSRVFFFEHPVVYHDPSNEFMAFIFPRDYQTESGKWIAKMEADSAQVNGSLPEGERPDYSPMVFFGIEQFQEYLEEEDNLADEIEIARCLAKSLDFDLYSVRPSLARSRRIPHVVPLSKAAESDTKDRMIKGLTVLVRENSRLVTFKRFLDELLKCPEDRGVPASR